MKRNKTTLQLPFKKEWFVNWGGDDKESNRYHHEVSNQKYAFDFVIKKNNATHQGEGAQNEDYYAFGQEIVAPADGIVVRVINNIFDNQPGTMNVEDISGNTVILKHSADEFSVLAHFKQGSIKVKTGDKIKTGQVVGLCGNSGNSSEPHLHYHLQDSNDMYSGEGIKCYFQDVVVNNKKTIKGYSPVIDDIISSN